MSNTRKVYDKEFKERAVRQSYDASNNSRTTRQDDGEIYSSAARNKDILQLQISSIAPDLMIVCSDDVFNGLIDNGLLGEGIEFGKNWELQKPHLGQSKTGNLGNKYLNPGKPDKSSWFRYPTK